MADNHHHHHHHHNQEGLNDDFLEQILAIPSYPGTNNDGNLAGTTTTSSMILQLNNSTDTTTSTTTSYHHGHGGGGTLFSPPLGLSLGETATGGFMKPDEASGSGNRFSGVDDHHHLLLNTTDHHHHLQQIGGGIPSSGGKNDRGGGGGGGGGVHLTGLFPAFGHVQTHSGRPTISHHHQVHQPFHGQPTPAPVAAAPHPPAIRPRVRARRGQATDPHSIAERLRRERIAERMKALQELVPSSNKTDRAAMLDEIVDYVKFLRLQVKVLSMSRLGGAGAVAQLVADTPLSSIEGEAGEGGSNQETWEKWSNDGTEQQVAKLMEEDVGAAMQFLQSKALCIMPISLATAIYHSHQTDNSGMIKPEPNAHS